MELGPQKPYTLNLDPKLRLFKPASVRFGPMRSSRFGSYRSKDGAQAKRTL